MIVEPMVQRGLPRKDSINPLSKKQNLGILTFYKVRLFKKIKIKKEVDKYYLLNFNNCFY